MKIIRSTKCSLIFATAKKRAELKTVLVEYGRVVNIFIQHFWKNGSVHKMALSKPVVDIPKDTWLSCRLRFLAAREALDMVASSKAVVESNKRQLSDRIHAAESVLRRLKYADRKSRRKANKLRVELKSKGMKLPFRQPTMPIHAGKSMAVSCTITELQEVKNATGFDGWLRLWCIGNKMSLMLPIKYHKHFNALANKGKRLNAYIIHENCVQFVFEIETGPKKPVKSLIGVDTGINSLATLSTGEHCGTDIKANIARIKRCQCNSKGHKKAIRALKQRIDEVAKEVVQKADLIVVENLKNITFNLKLKGRLSKNIRSAIGIWGVRYWLMRLQQNCEISRALFRSVLAYYTSIMCSVCGHADGKSRLSQEMFQCSACGHAENADSNAAKNILNRFLTGPYGASYKAEVAI